MLTSDGCFKTCDIDFWQSVTSVFTTCLLMSVRALFVHSQSRVQHAGKYHRTVCGLYLWEHLVVLIRHCTGVLSANSALCRTANCGCCPVVHLIKRYLMQTSGEIRLIVPCAETLLLARCKKGCAQPTLL